MSQDGKSEHFHIQRPNYSVKEGLGRKMLRAYPAAFSVFGFITSCWLEENIFGFLMFPSHSVTPT